ncbi:transposase family protein [Streptomyces cyaneofuscatus]|uniref:transposase family protein n=1 Tax=Streptomyces cyaneofuscatus TaxID=66883 RepID=UPI0033A5A814
MPIRDAVDALTAQMTTDVADRMSAFLAALWQGGGSTLASFPAQAMVFTDGNGRLLFCSPTRPGGCADITHARELGLVKLLADGPAVEILADAGYHGLGAQTGGRVVTPPHRKFKKDAPDWYEEVHERRRKAHSSRRIRVEHGIAHMKNWRALARHLGRREHMDDTVQAVASLLTQQQTADQILARQT